jgi:putative endonuclease
VTGDLPRRGWQYREGEVEGFTKRYGVKRLVYYEVFEDVWAAIAREKRLKRYKRDWKIALIERDNPDWRDLYPSLLA